MPAFRLETLERHFTLSPMVLVECVGFSYLPKALQSIPCNWRINSSPEIALMLSTLPVLSQT